jgi:Flp pilus assembly protein TadD
MPIPQHSFASLDQAHAACLARLQGQPGDAYSHQLLAMALWLRGDGEQALSSARAAQVLRPDDPDGMSHQAQMRASRGELAEALMLFRRALVIRPWPSARK